MLDIKLIREQPDLVKTGLSAKGQPVTLIDDILAADAKVQPLRQKIEDLRAERNKIAAMGPHASEQGKKVKQEIESLTEEFNEASAHLEQLLLTVPNLPDASAPVGPGESANRVTKTVGEKPVIANPDDHVTIGEKYDLFDIQRGSKVAGARFNYLKNQAVLLELALVRFALDIVQKHDFKPMITPELVNEATVTGTGYLPLGADEVYKTQDDLYLIGTSELALVAYHKDEVLAESQLPVRYAGFSSCFRREAGSYGKDTRGILRQHQFDKVEMVSFVKPEDSEAELQLILSIEEELMQALQLPYHILEIGTGDLGMQASKKYDVETWMPGQDTYRETHSCSNTTDFQARRLNIRYRSTEGKNVFVHTLNGTAIAVGRILIAILENGQQPDGSIRIPDILVPYCGFSEIK